MRPRYLLALLVSLILTSAAIAQPQKRTLELHSDLINPGIPLAESDKPVHRLSLVVEVNPNNEGTGTVVLDRATPEFDEYGGWTISRNTSPLKFECNLTFVKKTTISYRTGHVRDEDWSLYSLKGPKLTTKLFYFTPTGDLTSGRVLVHGKEGKVQYAVGVRVPPPPEPCHPGCFPAGTLVRVPAGTQAIERLQVGDAVTSVTPEGTVTRGVIEKVFTTRNRLVEVRTDTGNVVTTDAQPFCLAASGYRKAGDLKPGDRVLTWRDARRGEATIVAVAPTGRHEQVFNLILRESALFIAGDFLVRGKPPAETVTAP